MISSIMHLHNHGVLVHILQRCASNHLDNFLHHALHNHGVLVREESWDAIILTLIRILQQISKVGTKQLGFI